MTSGELGKLWVRGLCLASCLVLAGCMGGGSGGSTVDEGPDVIVDPGDSNDDPIIDDGDDDDPIDVIADIVTDVVTTSVSVTTATQTSGI